MTTLSAAEYDAWYASKRGAWIGKVEYQLLLDRLQPQACESLLDVGCGTGWFTRQFAQIDGLNVTGLDINQQSLHYARLQDPHSHYLQGDARALPFADKTFDRSVSVTALCFVDNWPLAIQEMIRVTRSRFAIALLNRNGLLWREKGQRGGQGAYRGAHWHTIDELRSAFDNLPVQQVEYHSAVFLPSGSEEAQQVETLLSNDLDWGSFLVVSGTMPSAQPAQYAAQYSQHAQTPTNAKQSERHPLHSPANTLY